MVDPSKPLDRSVVIQAERLPPGGMIRLRVRFPLKTPHESSDVDGVIVFPAECVHDVVAAILRAALKG